MDWNSAIKGFYRYLLLELGHSENTLDSYQSDLRHFAKYCEDLDPPVSVGAVTIETVEHFLGQLYDEKKKATSQARYLSSIKAFFRYARLEDLISSDPVAIMQGPKTDRKLPVVLSIDEVDRLMGAIDLSSKHGTRNRAMLETLYACGLRVTELCELRLSNLHPDMELVKVLGKGRKERWVPVSQTALKHLNFYINGDRREGKIVEEDIVFLNNRGGRISRQQIFLILKKACRDAGIRKKVSPHVLRHSFATHLLRGGANLKAIQDMLGHESITTTEIYTHIDRDQLRKAILRYHPRNRS